MCLVGRKLFHTVLNLGTNIQVAFVTRFLEAEAWFCSCLGRVSLDNPDTSVTCVFLVGRLAGIQPGYRNTSIVSNSDICSSLRGCLGCDVHWPSSVSCVLRQVSLFKNVCFVYFCTSAALCLFCNYTPYLC